ncbi:unnamed protein product [Symbiodinium natans]|uniref:Uncharacterized protein n=1 Tax=Symbiodinium natans TaxID=878477 RepID=A0A812K553_9DINO|nr:unnamed protein product [Symbiodinium natans]
MALHLDCTDSDAQQITVEPSGGGSSFKLRRSPHTLPNDWKYDSDKKTIKKTSGNKCLEARGRGRVEEVDCSQRIEQEWTMSHGLPGLVDAPISCPGDQVISYMKKTHSQIQYKCSHVSSLGMCSPHYSTQVETKSPELETIKALRQLGAFCPPGEGLKSFESEASDKGAWIRFKYECCQISRVPVSIYPLMTGAGKRDFDTGMAQAWEGIYCPSGSTNGRVDFTQSRSFKPGQSASGTLKYDKNDGKWCVSGKDCAYSDVVHPLDLQLHTSQWYVVPVSDFDAIFEARGAKTTPKKKRKPPPLIKFGASDPEYLPECKDESHPGARKFKLASMNEEAKELDDENPCKYVYGAPPTNQDMDGADGMTGWIDDLVDTVGPGQGGVTYKSVKECSDRDIVRELQMAKWSQAHNYHTMGFDYARDLIMAYADGMPEVEAAPIGAGFEFQPGSILAAYSTWYFNTIQLGEDIAMQQHEMHFEQAGHDDCNPIQHGFARTFCDLHCIRDAVRKGDDAILRALEEAVEIIGKNTQLLLEHYVGEESGSLLVEEASKIRRGLATQFQELRAVAQEAALETRASLAGARAIKAFAGRWRHQGNVSGLASLHTMAGEVAQLHSTVTAVSSQKLSRVEEMQQNSLETVAYMNKFLKARAHVLGLYHQTASRAKTAQTWFKQHWTNKMSVLDELRDASVAQALETFDTMWWQVRRKLDAYLDAADDHTRAMSHAVDSLRSYAGQCHASFVQLKKSYAASIRAEKHDHATLKSTWSEMAVQVGMIASKIVDAKLLDQLALADAKVAKQPDVGKAERATICGNSSAALMSTRAHLAEAMTNGFLGQTQNQLSILFGEMAMLQQRYHAALGEAPGAEEVRLAQGRLSAAMKAARLGVDNLATSIAEHWRSHLCK